MIAPLKAGTIARPEIFSLMKRSSNDGFTVSNLSVHDEIAAHDLPRKNFT
jgi:hypothetical protein